ncbi:hypothetical protein M011DRAFT_167429 [Sporormia fimetaria CBS 119925]|uniref:Uncharacterized protein n=1 Tax=Sporormia fimetaria CBS 119925 TaxID=1340428 RepID=A0A6A6V5P7_9PLEO|nr:hypothetical protein M011DRAFT_167429 [Sporormia fimetaria CBS 119925]
MNQVLSPSRASTLPPTTTPPVRRVCCLTAWPKIRIRLPCPLLLSLSSLPCTLQARNCVQLSAFPVERHYPSNATSDCCQRFQCQ